VFLVPGGVSADVKKLGKGNTSWVEKPPGKIFGEAMQKKLLLEKWGCRCSSMNRA
jgi:hypothetical protein